MFYQNIKGYHSLNLQFMYVINIQIMGFTDLLLLDNIKC